MPKLWSCPPMPRHDKHNPGYSFIPAEDILILKDQDSFFTTMANVVKAEDYEGFERCVDEAATEKARQRALDKGNLDLQGNPVYNKVFKKSLPSKKEMCRRL